jgi:hypothetical protein
MVIRITPFCNRGAPPDVEAWLDLLRTGRRFRAIPKQCQQADSARSRVTAITALLLPLPRQLSSSWTTARPGKYQQMSLKSSHGVRRNLRD